jgi:hypothetical protein
MNALLEQLTVTDTINAALIAIADQSTPPVTLEAAIHEQARTRTLLNAAEAVKSALEKRHDWLRTAVVPPKMDERGITNIKLVGIGRVHLSDDVYVSIPQETKPAAYQWFRDNGLGDLITQTINGSTLAAFIRKRIKAGDEMPEGVKITAYTKAVITG